MPIFQKLLDVLAPSNCVGCGTEGRALCQECTSVNVIPYGERCYLCGRLSAGNRTCPKCSRLGGPTYLWISTTYNDVAEKLVEQYKFYSVRSAVKSIANLMTRSIAPANLSSYVVVPVPTASSRIRERGFDHAALLAKQIAKDLNLEWANALTHNGQARQVGATRTVRFKQALASYQVSKPKLIQSRKVLLVDDVVTSGATMQVCSQALRKAGARRVDGLVFAKRL